MHRVSIILAVCWLSASTICAADAKKMKLAPAQMRIAAELLASSPNRAKAIDPRKDDSREKLSRLGVDHQFRITTEPGISLQFWVIEPRDKKGNIVKPDGTIFMLHGVFTTKKYMYNWSHVFLNAGYRVVLVDSRGHGRSTGKYLTYGVKECSDLTKILDFLEKKGLVTEPVGVFGHSYGAATAIQWAGREDRIKAVAVVAPFADLRSVAMNYAKKFAPVLLRNFTHAQLQRIITMSAKVAGFDADQASPEHLIAKATQAKFVLMHGKKDINIPPEHSEKIKKSACSAGVPCDIHILDNSTHAHFSRNDRTRIVYYSLKIFSEMDQPAKKSKIEVKPKP